MDGDMDMPAWERSDLLPRGARHNIMSETDRCAVQSARIYFTFFSKNTLNTIVPDFSWVFFNPRFLRLEASLAHVRILRWKTLLARLFA